MVGLVGLNQCKRLGGSFKRLHVVNKEIASSWRDQFVSTESRKIKYVISFNLLIYNIMMKYSPDENLRRVKGHFALFMVSLPQYFIKTYCIVPGWTCR
jgi:hypothetical protein